MDGLIMYPMESTTAVTTFTASSLMGSLLSVLNAEGAKQIYTVLMEEKFLDGLSTILEASTRKLATCLGVTIEELQTQIISAQLEIPRASVRHIAVHWCSSRDSAYAFLR